MREPERVKPKPAAGFLSLPASRIGKWSAWLLVVSLILVLLNNLVVMSQTEQNTDLELAQRIFNLFVFLCVVASGLTGLLAVSSSANAHGSCSCRSFCSSSRQP